jgi:hypothetical protein
MCKGQGLQRSTYCIYSELNSIRWEERKIADRRIFIRRALGRWWLKDSGICMASALRPGCPVYAGVQRKARHPAIWTCKMPLLKSLPDEGTWGHDWSEYYPRSLQHSIINKRIICGAAPGLLLGGATCRQGLDFSGRSSSPPVCAEVILMADGKSEFQPVGTVKRTCPCRHVPRGGNSRHPARKVVVGFSHEAAQPGVWLDKKMICPSSTHLKSN